MNNQPEIILASKSPRRKRIFEILECPFRVMIPENVMEGKNHHLPPEKTVIDNSRKKAESCLEKVQSGLIIAADTEVFLGGRIFGKPKDKEEALEMLKTLSGRTHIVATGVSVIDLSWHREDIDFFDISYVTFRHLEKRDILLYMEKTNVFDKAGAYAVQAHKGSIISGIKGSTWNVIGFPMEKFRQEIINKDYFSFFKFPENDSIQDVIYS
ncbi:MAG: septum formation protein Maf [Candidatus Aureabacteria bacterium]|nr:septum formation protein Maf [Candidatus Auribacterota bacterium]